jgi:hypothetical protein
MTDMSVAICIANDRCDDLKGLGGEIHPVSSESSD